MTFIGVIWMSRIWKSAISSWWCKTERWLQWNTYMKSISDFQNPTPIWPWMALFQGNESENCMWRLTDERWVHACYRSPNFIRWPWPRRRLIWRNESAIPAIAGLLVFVNAVPPSRAACHLMKCILAWDPAKNIYMLVTQRIRSC